MSLRTKLLLPIVVAMIATSWSQVVDPIVAKPGTVATGHIESERDGRLYLNPSPCRSQTGARIVVFHSPYKKTAAGQINCYPRTFDGYTVEQR